MGGRILAINEGAGYRPVLVVQSVHFYPQFNANRPSTVLFGSQVMFPDGPYGGPIMSANDVSFSGFLSNLIGYPTVWNQLTPTPGETLDQFYTGWPQLPLTSVSQATVKLVASGYDPIRGYWIQFDNTIAPLFAQANWWDGEDLSGAFGAPTGIANGSGNSTGTPTTGDGSGCGSGSTYHPGFQRI